MRVINHNWSATKQRLHPQSVVEISRHSVLSGGQDSTLWDIVWVSPQGHRSVSVSRHFLLQAPQCPCSVRQRFSRDHCCRGRSKPGCLIVGSQCSFSYWLSQWWNQLQSVACMCKLSTDTCSSLSNAEAYYPPVKWPSIQMPAETALIHPATFHWWAVQHHREYLWVLFCTASLRTAQFCPSVSKVLFTMPWVDSLAVPTEILI